MKKKIAVFACVLMLVFALAFTVAAEETGESGENLWDFWSLLNSSNVDYIGVAVMLLTTIFTIFRVFFSNGGLKSLSEVIGNALKQIVAFK